jgi:hypothetical protein
MGMENAIKANNEVYLKLELEKNMIKDSISSKDREISELEFLVLKKLPSEFSDFEYLLKKEIEIYNKAKMENNNIYQKNEKLAGELKEMINIYKKIAHLDLEKTKEGYLKIIFFKNIPNSKIPEGANIVIEILENNFNIISVHPKIKITPLDEELQNSHNFTKFLTKLANEFLKLI